MRCSGRPRSRDWLELAAGGAGRAACRLGAAAARRLPEGRRPLPTPAPRLLRGRRRHAAAGRRTARTGSRSNTTRCTAACSAGSSRWSRPPCRSAGLAARCCSGAGAAGERAARRRSPGTSRRTSSASTPPAASAGRRPKARTATASTWWRWCWSGAHNIKGGETRVFEAGGRRGERFTLSEPWTLLLLDDARVIHEIDADPAAGRRAPRAGATRWS